MGQTSRMTAWTCSHRCSGAGARPARFSKMTAAGRIDGFDHCEALGVSFVVHRNDVDIDGEPDFRRGRLDRNRKVGTT